MAGATGPWWLVSEKKRKSGMCKNRVAYVHERPTPWSKQVNIFIPSFFLKSPCFNNILHSDCSASVLNYLRHKLVQPIMVVLILYGWTDSTLFISEPQSKMRAVDRTVLQIMN